MTAKDEEGIGAEPMEDTKGDLLCDEEQWPSAAVPPPAALRSVQDPPGGNPPDDAAVPPEESRANVITMADIRAKPIDWIWRNRIPRGTVTFLDGEPGIGKSSVMADLIARLTTGNDLPSDDTQRPTADVVLIGLEDDLASTVRPRMDAARADTVHVHVMTGIGGDPGRAVKLPDDVDEIERIIRRTKACLLVIDPISSHLGSKIDMNSDTSVRDALMPLVAVAQRTGCTMVLLRHLRKAGEGSALNRGIGSVGFVGIARAVMLLANDPEDPSAQVLAWSKLNGGTLPRSLKMRRQSSLNGAPSLTWEGECGWTAEDLVRRQDRYRKRGDRGDSKTTDKKAAWESLRVLVLNVIKENPGLTSKDAIAANASKRKADVGPVVEELESQGLVVKVKAGRAGRFYTKEAAAALEGESALEPAPSSTPGDDVGEDRTEDLDSRSHGPGPSADPGPAQTNAENSSRSLGPTRSQDSGELGSDNENAPRSHGPSPFRGGPRTGTAVDASSESPAARKGRGQASRPLPPPPEGRRTDTPARARKSGRPKSEAGGVDSGTHAGLTSEARAFLLHYGVDAR